jgi:glutathione-specific gamma-glutamylcyclotransferase
MKQPTHVMRLTPDHVARVQRTAPDPGPRPGIAQMGDADYAQYADELAAGFGGAPLRIFAYGSLIWKPEFEFTRQCLATLPGWHRSFCMRIERWRGTRECPGLMMALDRGGSCRGVVFELPAGNEQAQLERLLRREMTNKPPTNMPRLLAVNAGGAVVKALAFTSSRSAYSYAGKLPLKEVARILASAAGHVGTCAEYLFNTVSHLEQLGIHDRNLWQLQELVAEEISRKGPLVPQVF